MEQKKNCDGCEKKCSLDAQKCGKGGRMSEADREGTEQMSLSALLGRCGYIADKKSGRQRGQTKILRILSHHGEMTQKDLQEMLHIEAGSLSEILSKLEEKGHIRRYKDEKDRRRMVICMTEEGSGAVKAETAGGEPEEYFSVLTEEEKEQLRSILSKLLEQWQQERKLWKRGGGNHE